MIKLRRALPLLALVALAVTLAACGSGASTTPGGGDNSAPTDTAKIVDGGILRIGYTDPPDGISPFVGSNQVSYVIFQEMYPALVQYDENYQLTGDWAESWTVSDDNRTYTFKLRPGKWSDGQPLTAEDAVWTIQTILKYKKGATGLMAAYIAGVESVRAPDDLTLEVTFAEPKATALSNLQPLYILPQHEFEQHVGNGGKDLLTWDMKAEGKLVGGGPFTVKQYDEKGTTLLERNPGYYGPRPHLDAVGMTVYQNPDAMVSAFKAGEIDAMDKVPVTLVEQVKAMPDVQVVEGLVPDVVNIGFNSNPKKTTHRELLDPQVKQAMAHAVNREKIIATVYNGYAEPAASILTPIAGDYLDKTITPETYDLALANTMLDDAGYTKGADGIRVTPDGERMSYDVLLPTDIQGQQRKFEIVQSDWKNIGIEVTGKPMDGSAAWDEMMAPDGKYLNFDIHMWSWLGYIDPDFMLTTVMCDQYGNWSDTGYCNPEYDALYAKQAAEMDPVKRQAIVHEMQQILYRDHPYIFIAQSEFIRAYKGGWAGITPPYLVYVSKLPWDTIGRTG
ncbi:MAG: ABC transporter substrate-binding protein [Actinobacteria bacterium]|nr:ABC transporter substrate-binding protein [Actinomycetota bacterium]